jgi:chromosome partitioning protein
LQTAWSAVATTGQARLSDFLREDLKMDIAFMADKGGVGKSLLAYHVATRLRQQGHDVALIDLDQRATSSHWAMQTQFVPSYALADQVERQWGRHADRVWDTPAHAGADLRASLLDTCDLFVVVASSDVESQRAAVELDAMLRNISGCPPVVVVVNNVLPRSRRGADLQEAFRDAGIQVMNTVVRRFACYEYAQLDGQAVCEAPYNRADDAWADVCGITSEMLEVMETACVIA